MTTDAVTLVSILLARCVPLVMLTPFLAHEAFGRTTRLAFALGLAALVAPLVVDVPLVPDVPRGAPLVAILVHEVAVGALLGFLASLVFDAAQMAGSLVDRAAHDQRLPVFERAYGLLAVCVFFAIGGHHLWLRALARSYVAFSPSALAKADASLALEVGRAAADAISLAVLLALPALATGLLIAVFAACCRLAAPRLESVFGALPLRALAVVGVVALSAGVVADELAVELPAAMSRLIEVASVR